MGRAAEAQVGALDWLLTDLQLPDMHGSTLAHELRATHPGLRVIYISGADNAMPDDAPFVRKPIDFDALLDVVDQELGAERA